MKDTLNVLKRTSKYWNETRLSFTSNDDDDAGVADQNTCLCHRRRKTPQSIRPSLEALDDVTRKRQPNQNNHHIVTDSWVKRIDVIGFACKLLSAATHHHQTSWAFPPPLSSFRFQALIEYPTYEFICTYGLSFAIRAFHVSRELLNLTQTNQRPRITLPFCPYSLCVYMQSFGIVRSLSLCAVFLCVLWLWIQTKLNWLIWFVVLFAFFCCCRRPCQLIV